MTAVYNAFLRSRSMINESKRVFFGFPFSTSHQLRNRSELGICQALFPNPVVKLRSFLLFVRPSIECFYCCCNCPPIKFKLPQTEENSNIQRCHILLYLLNLETLDLFSFLYSFFLFSGVLKMGFLPDFGMEATEPVCRTSSALSLQRFLTHFFESRQYTCLLLCSNHSQQCPLSPGRTFLPLRAKQFSCGLNLK